MLQSHMAELWSNFTFLRWGHSTLHVLPFSAPVLCPCSMRSQRQLSSKNPCEHMFQNLGFSNSRGLESTEASHEPRNREDCAVCTVPCDVHVDGFLGQLYTLIGGVGICIEGWVTNTWILPAYTKWRKVAAVKHMDPQVENAAGEMKRRSDIVTPRTIKRVQNGKRPFFSCQGAPDWFPMHSSSTAMARAFLKNG